MNPNEQRVRKIISEQLGIEESKVTPEKRMGHSLDMRKEHLGLGADSLDAVELMMALEDEFGIDIPDDDICADSTVQQVYDYINQRVQSA